MHGAQHAQRTFGEGEAPVGADGLLYGGFKQFGVQLLASAVAIVYAVAATWMILKVIDKVSGLRATKAEESEGLDTAVHGERGYAG